MIAAVLLVVQVTLWAHARSVAQGAADHGAEIAAAYDGSIAAGEAAAVGFITTAGQVGEPQVVVERSATTVVVVVRGSYPSVFGRLAITARSSAPVERVDP